MSSASLTAKYRPQRFSDVAGQQAIKRILSKASAEDRIAPAYLFSGTRGVGKTTLARVLAKALNCERAPTAEPCNECAQCRQITAGISPDVIEIDAATHGGVDEARRLKEDIGYAPLQSRYKVFIIDEAHMLSKAAFNALLKTLEEPPGRVTFILATTEPHKILPTIISRCQHYIFKRLALPELEAHLSGLLEREGLGFDPQAVSLIARRGAGSVRDSMSLLGQVLALGGERLTEEDVREVLGLAGQDVFLALMQAFLDQDCLGVTRILRQVLDRGLDIGFFLRELASSWRNMFILNQAGERALESMEISAEEGARWLEWSGKFDTRHIHACWQMTLEGQRRVMTSLEPALALELLLLNLAYLPRLIALDPHAQGCALPAQTTPRPAPRPAPGHAGQPQTAAGGPARQATPRYGAPGPSPAPAPSRPAARDGSFASGPPPGQTASAGAAASPAFAPHPAAGVTPSPSSVSPAGPSPDARPYEAPSVPAPATQPSNGYAASPPGGAEDAPFRDEDAGPQAAQAVRPRGPRDWNGFHHYLRDSAKAQGRTVTGLGILKGQVTDGPQGARIALICHGEAHQRQLESNPEVLAFLRDRAKEYFGPDSAIEFVGQQMAKLKTPEELREDLAKEPLYQEAVESLGGQVLYVKPRTS
ncbi:DNA polymerase III subunit gamma/tau [Fundidesulfovibrio butyratiphilus]